MSFIRLLLLLLQIDVLRRCVAADEMKQRMAKAAIDEMKKQMTIKTIRFALHYTSDCRSLRMRSVLRVGVLYCQYTATFYRLILKHLAGEYPV